MDLSFSNIVLIVFVALVLLTLKLGINIVPQSENWLVERLGKFNRKLEAGLHLIIPFFETVRYKVPIRSASCRPSRSTPSRSTTSPSRFRWRCSTALWMRPRPCTASPMWTTRS